MSEEVLNQEDKYVDIHPLKKGKRMLLFLADFFIHFMLCFFIFNAMTAPIGKAITGFKEKNDEHINLTAEMYNHYYKSGVLLEDASFDRLDVTAGVEYTYRCFLSYFVIDTEESIDTSHPQYGHKIANNTVYHYYHDIRNDDNAYYASFKDYNSKHNYFVFEEATNTFYLKNEVKNELYSFFDVKDEMGQLGEEYYSNILNDVFNPLLAEVMRDIEKNDLHYEGEPYSFLECKNRIKEIEKYHENLMTACAYITHFVIWLALFVITPLVNKNRKTLAMIFMKIERVNFYTLNISKKGAVLLNAFYYLFSTLLGILFVPSLLVPFNNLFTFRFLIYGSVFSLLLLLGSMIFTLVNQYNRSLSDYLSNSLYLTEEEMDELYRARGYTI